MTAEEVEYRLSKAGRGELKEEVVVIEGVGDGAVKQESCKSIYQPGTS